MHTRCPPACPQLTAHWDGAPTHPHLCRAALSHAFRACAAGNVGAPLLLKRGGGSSEAMVQVGVLASGFACSTDPSVASASSPALYTWLPRYADWLEEQLNRLERENGGGVDSQSVSKHDAPAAAGGAKEGGGHRS